MRLSQSLAKTRKEAPKDAETRGIQMLIRAGYVKKLSSGLYINLPLMQRVIHKLEKLIRQELQAISEEVSFPLLQPATLWQESGRWAAYTEAEGIMFTLQDRSDRSLALGPTHEEVALTCIRDLAQSYKDLPLSIYQIGHKFRDELRPRFGLLRTREFVMKDAYSFHADTDDLKAHFEQMSQAYSRILDRLKLNWRVVDADSGNIGGAGSREYMVLSDIGEDEILFSPDGKYAANTEKAESLASQTSSPFIDFVEHHTPNTPTVASACDVLGCEAEHMVKNVLYDAVFEKNEQRLLRPVMVSLRGDHQVNPVKLWNAVQQRLDGTLLSLEVAQSEAWSNEPLPLGYLAPNLADTAIAQRDDIQSTFLRLCDLAAAKATNFATGANKTDFHVVGANWNQQFDLPDTLDLRLAQAGDTCLHDSSQQLQTARGIEVGHVFQLGNKYAKAMNATFTNPAGKEQFFEMGCYGLGVSRLAQAVAEQLADEHGLIWPQIIAPFDVLITVVDSKNTDQMQAAENLYQELQSSGLEVLLDDRPERAGAKFADADLWGIPQRVTIGRALAQGEIELKERKTGEQLKIKLTETTQVLSEKCLHS